MINTKQPKKSNTTIRFSLGNPPPLATQITGKPIKKNRPAKQKLHKNLSQLPCGIFNDWKQNASLANLMIARPHSSLVASDISGSLSKSREKADINFICKDKLKLKKISSKRNTLAIDDTQVKVRRASGTSQSHKKWNNRSLQEDPSVLKLMMAENRKKYNLSCGDMIESKSKCKQIVQKGKKKSLQVNPKNPLTKAAPKKKSQKLQEGEIKKFKPSNLAQKSKGSTTIINPNQTQQKMKKKQNKQNKKKQRSHSKSKSKSKRKNNYKSNKMFVLLKGDQDEKSLAQHQYPISKYVDMKKKGKKKLNIKVGLDYNHLALNIISASSGVIGNQDFSSSIDRNEASKILPLQLDNGQQDSINIEQIKQYQKYSPLKLEQAEFERRKKIRVQIQEELEQQYPYLNSTELEFLSSVVLIQRKWRQRMLYKHLNQHKQVVTEYFVEQGDKSKEFFKRKSKFSKDRSKNQEKVQVMSRTKLGEFEGHDELKQTINKVESEQIDQNEFQTRKNSIKNEIIILSREESEKSIQVNSEQLQGDLTERKPATQTNRINVSYAWRFQRQVFPEVNYLEYRKNMVRQEFQKTMKQAMQEHNSKKITDTEFQYKKTQILHLYQKSLSSLKKTKHDIKKGYLKYIDCIKQIKSIHDPSNKLDNRYGLRKVSSDSNFLFSLYQKIFKFDKCMSEWSGGSESIQMLTKKILIRKEFFKHDRKSQRRSLSDLRSAARSSYEMIRTSRDAENGLIVFEHTDRFINLDNSDRPSQDIDRSQMVQQFKFSNEIFKSKQPQPRNKQQQERAEIKTTQIPHKVQQEQPVPIPTQKQNIKTLTNSISLLSSPQTVLSKIQQQIILQLTRQLERDIHSINPVLVDIILINQPELSQFDGVEFYDNQEEEDQKSPAMQNLHRDLEEITSPRNNQEEFVAERNYETEPAKILEYLFGLVSYIRKKNWTQEILFNVNNNQTFQAIAYLKFLRDFEIPDDEYVPIINNEKFIEWETFYNSQNENRNQNNQILRQSQTIFHRCIFQVFLAELEKNRPYGQRGRPFPWQQKFSYHTIRQVVPGQLTQIFQKSLQKIEQYLIYRCGLISQKLLIMNEQDLERAHEENQDRIIEMLEQDLMETGHKWYEVEEHALEIKLEIAEIVEELLMEEIGRELGRGIRA